jgi:hypothetical protein
LVASFALGQDIANRVGDGISDREGDVIDRMVRAAQHAIDRAVTAARNRIPSSLEARGSFGNEVSTKDVIDYGKLSQAIAGAVGDRVYQLNVTTSVPVSTVVQDFSILEAMSRGGT